MATVLYRLGKTAYRRWPFFLASWLLVIIGVGAIATTLSKPMSDAFTIPGVESVETATLQTRLFPTSTNAAEQAGVTVAVAAPKGHTLTEPAYAAKVRRLITDLENVPTVPDGLKAPGAPGSVSKDGRIGTIDFAFDVKQLTDVKPAKQDRVLEALESARHDGLTAEVMGQGMQVQEAGGTQGELIGIAIALIILTLTFGALVAAGMPIVTAGIGVAIGTSGITALTALIDVPSSTPMLATMLGLAVGIDYTLFILARYRSELDHATSREEAIGRAVGTAGSAVVFAGLTVIIAMVALGVVGIPFLAAMGYGAAATVAVAVLVALTLLPALLGLLKSKAFGGRVRRYTPRRDDQGRVLNNGVRWARLVGRKPIVAVLLVVVALGGLAVPLKDMHLGLPTDSNAAKDNTQRKAADLVTEGFGPGRLSPMMIVVDGRHVAVADQKAAYQRVADWAGKQEHVAGAQVVAANDKGAMIVLAPTTGPSDVRTDNLLSALRDGEPAIEKATGTHVGVTGITAIQDDVSAKLSSALPIYLGVVIGLAFLLLMVVFRSLLVPLTATAGFLLSVLATLGATVAVFQEGAFGIFPGQPIISFLPIFLIGVVFGLAMDYQVFLVSRIREAHVHGASYREAVVEGFRNSARVVTAAAMIMVAVFSGFILMPDAVIKSMGFALALAIIFDAFVVRMCLIPALMYLLGEKAWYLPRWPDRLLPTVDIEGAALEWPSASHTVDEEKLVTA